MIEKTMQDAMDRYSETRPIGYSQQDFAAGWKAREALAEKPTQVEPVGIVRHRKTTTPYADAEQFAQFTRALPAGSFLYALPPAASVPDAWSKSVLLPILEAAAAGKMVSMASGRALRELRAMLAAAQEVPS